MPGLPERRASQQREIRSLGAARDLGMRHVFLILEARKWLCRACGRYFRQQFPGILKWQRASERFRSMIFFRHWDGISRRRLGQREGIGSATVERWFLPTPCAQDGFQ